jgi:hypothetical protein
LDSSQGEAVFQLSLLGGSAGADVFGIWQPALHPVETELAFAMPEMMGSGSQIPSQTIAIPSDEIVVWRVELPGDSRQAAEALRLQLEELRLADRDLNGAQARLQAFAATTQPGMIQPVQSFTLGEDAVLSPEFELAGWLAPSQGVMDFALGISLPAGWQDTAREAMDFFEKVRKMLAYYANIESSSGGAAIGRTTVSWMGDFETLWRRGVAEDQVKLHRNSVDLALSSRQAWVKMAMLVTQGAALFGLLSSTGNPLMIPAVYKFIRQVLEQYREIRRTQAAGI